jgi:hypothetical protein
MKMKSNLKSALMWFVVGATLLITGCSQIENEPIIQSNNLQIEEGMIELGEEIENAYSVTNMQKAADNLFETGQLKSKPIIKTTHYYVRFLPKDDKELSLLKKDTTLYFYDFPLLYKLKKKGTSYHDPSLAPDQITWQYTVVPKDYPFNSVKYEILDEVFMEDEYNKNALKSASLDDFTFALIEKEAYRITGNLSSETPVLKSTSWTPSGTIQVKESRDNSGTETGVNGAYVRARYGLKTRHGYTSNGVFTINDSFTSSSVEICVVWDRYEFNIRDGSYYQAYTYKADDLNNGESWNVVIGRLYAPKSWLFAHIHQAAHTYYYEHSNWGIKSPSSRDWYLGQQLHIAARDEEGTSHCFPFNDFWNAATVVVYSSYDAPSYQGGTRLCEGYDIFDTTIHELAHVSHWELGYSVEQYLVDYMVNSAIMTESWATCVACVISSSRYPSTFPSNYYNNVLQNTDMGAFEEGYTPLFIDCMDNHNQGRWVTTRPNDRVEYYSLSELENALEETYIDLGLLSSSELGLAFNLLSYQNFQDNLYELYPNNPTRIYINTLFSCYN